MRGKIYVLMGKSASGKDSVFRELTKEGGIGGPVHTVTMYTTRPMRDGERDGREYFFVPGETLEKFRQEGKVIECRTYETVFGPWSYFTADDGQIDLSRGSYLMMGTLESYQKMKEYFDPETLVPLYLYVEDGERLLRALLRERQQEKPRYAELCRRFLADEEDFSEEKLAAAGVGPEDRFENKDLEKAAAWCRERMGD